MVVCGENEQNASNEVVLGVHSAPNRVDVPDLASNRVVEPILHASNRVVEPILHASNRVVCSSEIQDQKDNTFPCPTCYKSYSRLQYLQNHIPYCKKVECATDCEKCHKHFNCYSNLAKHRKICKAATTALEQQSAISQTINIHIENFHQNNGVVTNNVNIQLNDFGKERLDHIDPAFIEKCLKSLSGDGIPNMVKKIYCDPNVPENHNVKICNENKEFMSVREDNEWTFKDKHDTLDKVILNAWRPVYEHYIGEDCELRKLYEKEQYMGLQNRLLDICHQKRDVKFPLRRKVFPVFVNNDTIDNEEL